MEKAILLNKTRIDLMYLPNFRLFSPTILGEVQLNSIKIYIFVDTTSNIKHFNYISFF